MKRIDFVELTQWITHAALRHPTDLPEQLMREFQVSRRRAGALLRKLEASQWLVSEGTPRRPAHRPGPLRQVVKRYALAGLEEDQPWRDDFAPCFDLAPPIAHMAQHAFTELLNNAIDHSGGSRVAVSMRQTPMQLQMLVSDDGCGLFQHIAQNFDIAQAPLAMLELAKGRLTSAPERHSGHGLFFTSRLADVLDIHANHSAFQCRAWERGSWRAAPSGPVASRNGTSIYLAIMLDTPRTLPSVLQAQSASGSDAAFERTRVPLVLLDGGASGSVMLASRAEARRATKRLAQFRHAEIDFSGVDVIGHGFADEMFRVFGRDHPGLELHPVGMTAQVAAIVDSVRVAAG